MDLDSRHYSAAQLPNNDEGRIQPSTSSPSSTPCQETSSRSPSCPMCGSALLEKLKADLTVQSAATSVTDDGHALGSDSLVFSRVLTIAISRMCMIAKEIAVDERRLLTDDKDAMVGILENVCLMKTTIKYLLHEMCEDGSSADVHEMGRGGMAAEDDAAAPLWYEDEEEEEEEKEDDRGGSGSVLVFSKSGSFIERRDQGEDDDGDNDGNEHDGLAAEGKALPRKRGDQESESGSADQLTEYKYYSFFSREDDDDDDRNDRDGSHCSRSADGDGQETEVAIRMISGGLIGGIATMSLIAKDTSEAKKVMLADDKQALAEMLDVVRMVKLLI